LISISSKSYLFLRWLNLQNVYVCLYLISSFCFAIWHLKRLFSHKFCINTSINYAKHTPLVRFGSWYVSKPQLYSMISIGPNKISSWSPRTTTAALKISLSHSAAATPEQFEPWLSSVIYLSKEQFELTNWITCLERTANLAVLNTDGERQDKHSTGHRHVHVTIWHYVLLGMRPELDVARIYGLTMLWRKWYFHLDKIFTSRFVLDTETLDW
jgi:hypothetical protein